MFLTPAFHIRRTAQLRRARKEIYKAIGTDQSNAERKPSTQTGSIRASIFLERRLGRKRLRMRRALEAVLKPQSCAENSPCHPRSTTSACTQPRRPLRLVTTNDRVFRRRKTHRPNVPRLRGAIPAIPKKHRWDGIVYLHGLLPKTKDDSALNSVVVTSGDFGLAYLTERWAARFATELFRQLCGVLRWVQP